MTAIRATLLQSSRSYSSSRRYVISCALAASAALAGTAAQAQNGFTDPGNFGGPWSGAYGVTADGTVVVGYAQSGVNSRAFRWTSAGGLVNLGTLGGTDSFASGISSDGMVVVGYSEVPISGYHAFLWTQGATANGTTRFDSTGSSGGAMVDLGTLLGTSSYAYAVSSNGAVVVGYSQTLNNFATHAFRWVQGATADGTTSFDTAANGVGAMVDLGTLGGMVSKARGVSADGTVVVGNASTGTNNLHAFRWVQGATANGTTSFNTSGNSGGAMVDLGTLGVGGTTSYAYGVSADGTVVVGEASTAINDTHAFRWVQGATANGTTSFNTAGNSGGAMFDLGTLGGSESFAKGVSANGAVVVGAAYTTGDAAIRAFRWTQATGMQSVEDWLRAGGVTVPTDITNTAYGVSNDGSVVVGQLTTNTAFIARVAPSGSGLGSGLVTLADVQTSLAGTARGGATTLASASTVVTGAHGRPLMRRVAPGQDTFWLAGDWGQDNHGDRNGDLGLAEAGIGRNFGPVQVNLALGQTWAHQHQALNGQTNTDGTYLLAEGLIPVSGNLWAVLGGYFQQGTADLRRGYFNAGVQDASKARPDTSTWSLRARLEQDKAWQLVGADFSPYVDLSYAEAKLDAYTETGGGFPARFDSRTEKATDLRLGVNADKPLANGLALFGTLEAVHRFEVNGPRTSGEVLGLFSFNLAGQQNQQDWLRVGTGVMGKFAEGVASLSVNLTTQGEAPNAWLAANWQKAF